MNVFRSFRIYILCFNILFAAGGCANESISNNDIREAIRQELSIQNKQIESARYEARQARACAAYSAASANCQAITRGITDNLQSIDALQQCMKNRGFSRQPVGCS